MGCEMREETVRESREKGFLFPAPSPSFPDQRPAPLGAIKFPVAFSKISTSQFFWPLDGISVCHSSHKSHVAQAGGQHSPPQLPKHDRVTYWRSPTAPGRIALMAGCCLHPCICHTIRFRPLAVCMQEIADFRTNCSKTVEFLVKKFKQTTSSTGIAMTTSLMNKPAIKDLVYLWWLNTNYEFLRNYNQACMDTVALPPVEAVPGANSPCFRWGALGFQQESPHCSALTSLP